jgi:hypothetical protein
MQDVGGRPLVDVRINGKGPFPFILDTGAAGTVIAADLIEELAIRDGRIRELSLGEATITDLLAFPFPGLSGLGGDRPPRGVLSAAAFPGYLLTLDYPGRKIALRAGELPAPDQGRIHRVHVDSGSPNGLMLPLPFLDELKLTSLPVVAGRARTVAGEFKLMAAGVDGPIELGEYALDLPRVIFSDLRPGPAPGPGNVGFEVLLHFALTIDSTNRRLKFEKR